jgi:hypothetical protein
MAAALVAAPFVMTLFYAVVVGFVGLLLSNPVIGVLIVAGILIAIHPGKTGGE